MSDAAVELRLRTRFDPYPEYRPARPEIGGELPTHWKVRRLKNLLCPLQTGVSVNGDATTPAAAEETGVLKTSCVYGDVFRHDENKTVVPSEVNRVECPVVGNSLIVSRMNTPELVGSCGFVANDHPNLFLPDRLWLARVRDDHRDHVRFLWYAVSCPRTKLRMSSLATGASGSMRCLAQDDFLGTSVPTPEHDEQRAIADFLDRETSKIDALVAKKERLIELLQEKRTALITHAVTKGLDPNAPMKPSGIEWLGDIPAHWDTRRVKDVSRFVTSGSRGWAEYYRDEGAIFLRISNLSRRSIDVDMSRLQHVQPPIGAEGERTRVRTGDVLVSITALIGAVGVVPQGVEEAYVNQHIALVRPSATDVEPRWVAYCAFSSLGQEQFAMDLYGGTKDGLGLEDVRSLRLLVPPISEQRRIVCYLDDRNRCFNSLIERTKKGIEHLEEYRTALISAAVTGKIDVRGAVA